jgi:hypothetical protein
MFALGILLVDELDRTSNYKRISICNLRYSKRHVPDRVTCLRKVGSSGSAPRIHGGCRTTRIRIENSKFKLQHWRCFECRLYFTYPFHPLREEYEEMLVVH